jgi:hypothetical protein
MPIFYCDNKCRQPRRAALKADRKRQAVVEIGLIKDYTWFSILLIIVVKPTPAL